MHAAHSAWPERAASANTGSTTTPVAVQTGDEVDRGDDDPATSILTESLKKQPTAAAASCWPGSETTRSGASWAEAQRWRRTGKRATTRPNRSGRTSVRKDLRRPHPTR